MSSPKYPQHGRKRLSLAQKVGGRCKVGTWPCHPNGGGDPYHHYPLFTGFGGYVFGLDDAGITILKDVVLDSQAALRDERT